MIFFNKIKSELSQKIERDKLQGNEKLSDNFSLKSLFDGKILIHSGVKQLMPLIIILLFLSLYYISNRFKYEAIVKENNELKEERLDLQTTELIKIRKFKEEATRSAVIKRLERMGSTVTEPQTPPILIN